MLVNDESKVKRKHFDCYPTMHSLCSVIPRETREHMDRVAGYSEKLFRYIFRQNPDLVHNKLGSDFENFSEDVFRYHDIGRVYIPFEVLNKVEKLTDKEFQLIKDHTVNAVDAIKSIYKYPFPRSVMKQLVNVAMYHHERWDGGGYPYGLVGEDIPFEARICAVADTYDGITSWKPYKRRQITREEALDIIYKESGKQFDPDMVEYFATCMREDEC